MSIVLPQMRWLGAGCGILHEGVVEASHVVDNRHVSRFANVKNIEQNILMRARAMWQLQNPRSDSANIRAPDHARETRKRDERNRADRHEWERLRLERLEREHEHATM